MARSEQPPSRPRSWGHIEFQSLNSRGGYGPVTFLHAEGDDPLTVMRDLRDQLQERINGLEGKS